MHTLIIVDDEYYVLDRLKNGINWDELGFKLIGTVGNGKTALELIGQNPPDVLLTDIQMPEMDGIELIRQMRKIKPDIVCIIISAYDDFKYAQQAIEYGVRRYLLKPIDLNELTELFLSIVHEEIKHGQNLNKFGGRHDVFDENTVSNTLINKAVQYIKQNCECKMSLGEISEYLYINPAYFSSLFKKNTGQNFVDYVTKVKLEKAKELLLKSDYKITEIAENLGYDDYTYFCKVFKKAENVTPLEFRTKYILGR
ncbi:MAG: response regulator [Ruminiclostridium sp.]|nr:response regulator [Ruminiclostridium sp.]